MKMSTAVRCLDLLASRSQFTFTYACLSGKKLGTNRWSLAKHRTAWLHAKPWSLLLHMRESTWSQVKQFEEHYDDTIMTYYHMQPSHIVLVACDAQVEWEKTALDIGRASLCACFWWSSVRVLPNWNIHWRLASARRRMTPSTFHLPWNLLFARNPHGHL